MTADSDDEAMTGTMPERGAVTAVLSCGGSYTIPEGHHNGAGKVTANSLASQTSATAANNHILSGKTAWVNGSKITGTIPDKGTGVHSTSAGINNSGLYYYVPRGYYYEGTGDGWVYRTKAEAASTIGLTAGKLLKGQSVLDIAGTATSDANATAAQILSGRTAYVNGSKITGTIPDRGSVDNEGLFGWNEPNNNRLFVRLHEGYYIKYSNGDWPATCIQYPSLTSGIGLTANKIIKGQTVLGITGTAEGYYPDPTDIYYKGINAAGFAWTGGFRPDATQFTFVNKDGSMYRELVFGVSFNTLGYKKINIEGNFKRESNTSESLAIILRNSSDTDLAAWWYTSNEIVTHAELDISQYNSIPKGYKIIFNKFEQSSVRNEYYVNHIWFS